MNYGSGSRLPIHPILKQELSGPDLCVQHSEKGKTLPMTAVEDVQVRLA